MSSLALGHILPGTKWDYHIIAAVEGDSTHASTVFKAEVVPHEDTISAPKWAIVKIASPDNVIAKENLKRECQTYLLPGVASAACFRTLYDVLGDSAIALEWLDITLAEVKYQPDMRTYSIVRESLKTALSSCIALDEKKYINTDHKPRNILLSDIETSRITAKVGDLGLVFPVGDRIKVQPYAMRAPEVFLGQACTGPSQVWAIAAMLLCWIKPGVLGAGDSPHFLINEAWSMAKIKRLFPEWNVRAPDEGANHSLQVAVKSANRMSREEPVMQAILPFKEETQKIEVAQPLRDLLHLMLVVNLEDRPSGSSTLASAEFLAFEKFVDAQ